ncbi:hypothetical protein Vi05172_g3664 [Venturia inaequalis]|nr:hypothetical protein Vi05172_g3664 [Venturia inaequalis]
MRNVKNQNISSRFTNTYYSQTFSRPSPRYLNYVQADFLLFFLYNNTVEKL